MPRRTARSVSRRTGKSAIAAALSKAKKKAVKASKRLRKQLPKRIKKAKRSTVKAIKTTRKRIKKTAKITRKRFKQLAKPKQLRGRALIARRQEQRQEIKGTFDTSRSRIVQASEDPGASRPGEPPKRRTGEGRYSIKAELRLRGRKIVSRTFVDKKIAPYMAMYEFRQDGQQRPFLKPGLMNNLPQFQTRVGAELKRAATQVPKKKAIVK